MKGFSRLVFSCYSRPVIDLGWWYDSPRQVSTVLRKDLMRSNFGTADMNSVRIYPGVSDTPGVCPRSSTWEKPVQ